MKEGNPLPVARLTPDAVMPTGNIDTYASPLQEAMSHNRPAGEDVADALQQRLEVNGSDPAYRMKGHEFGE